MATSIQESKDRELLHDDEDSQPQKPRRSNSWENKNAIIYDATTQTLSKQKKANLDISNMNFLTADCAQEADGWNRRPHSSHDTQKSQEPSG